MVTEIAVIKEQSQGLLTEAETLVVRAEAIEISDDEEMEIAVSLLGGIATAKKRVEKQRKFFVEPLNQQVRKINELFHSFTDPLLKAERIIKQKVAAYHVERERKAQEEMAKTLAEAQKGDEIVPVILPEQPQRTVRTDTGSATIKKVWTFNVESPALVPEQYKVVDEHRIRAAVASGIREIPGVRIYLEPQVAVRGSSE
ncbi:hypothetical protein ES705_20737 [subsurface metagenome]